MSAASGFELRELRLCGPAVPPAQLTFKTGLNVIEGASDTGKSYAVSCIDFLLGAKDAPDEIPEAKGYDVGYLSVEARSGGEHFTLKRALVGGHIGLVRDSLDDAIAAADASWLALGVTAKAEESVSGFLLDLCGLAAGRVRSDAYGKTQAVSFRVLAKALIVDEQRIIAKRSPLYGTQRTGDTAAENTIRLLLTGVDDSQIVQPEDKKIAAGRLAGKKEIVEALIAQDEASLEALIGEEGGPTAQEVTELELAVAELSAWSSALLADLRAAEDARRQAWGKRRDSEERLRDLEGMLARAELLGQHYDSDLRRLEAMAESAYVLGHYTEDPCVYCGAEPEHQNRGDSDVLGRTMEAARVEAAKVRRLARELARASSQMGDERNQVYAGIEALDTAIAALSGSIDEELAPRTRETAGHLRAFQEQYGKWVRVTEIRTRLGSLREQLDDLVGGSDTREKLEFVKLTAGTMSGVCQEVGALLDAWGFAQNPAIAYDERTADLYIDARSRVSHGKGVRAVTCAAFVIAIMRHGMRNVVGHPGFVVVDTPLNPYKAADASDGGAVAQTVKTAFYRHLCTLSPGQVIVFENEPAPSDVQTQCNYVHFSGSASGRRGFIPSREPQAGLPEDKTPVQARAPRTRL